MMRALRRLITPLPTMTVFRCASGPGSGDPARCFSLVKPHQSVSGNAICIRAANYPLLPTIWIIWCYPRRSNHFSTNCSADYRPGTSGGDSRGTSGRTVAMPRFVSAGWKSRKWKRCTVKIRSRGLTGTNYSVEEIATKILDIMGLSRRMYLEN